jgi:hypothetical protein
VNPCHQWHCLHVIDTVDVAKFLCRGLALKCCLCFQVMTFEEWLNQPVEGNGAERCDQHQPGPDQRSLKGGCDG